MRCSRAIYIVLVLTLFLQTCEFENVIIGWKDGEIPYFFTGYFTNEEVAATRAAMDEWESVCGVRFTEILPRSTAYEIKKDEIYYAWSSSIGSNNVMNYMTFGIYDSYTFGHVLHELGHCLGLLHEHQRPDRDLYVEVVWDNIWPEFEFNFEIKNNPLIREEEFPYDYNSIMHYHSRGYSIDGNETILPKDGREIMRTDSLTEIDKEKVRAIYGPPLSEQE